MTEDEWLARSGHPVYLFGRVAGKGRARRLRLCASACCRRLPRLVPDSRCLKAIGVAEAFADRQAKLAELRAVGREIEAVARATPRPRTNGEWAKAYTIGAVWHLLTTDKYYAGHALQAALKGAVYASLPESAPCVTELDIDEDHPACAQEIAVQAALARDIFRQCFLSVAFDCSWRTPPALSLAQAAYDERILPSGELDPQRLAVLADALEEAGAEGELLEHLRSAGPHVRGCWAVDLLLGKE
jgi:hypothetical protein